jgi:hypothetical protein
MKLRPKQGTASNHINKDRQKNMIQIYEQSVHGTEEKYHFHKIENRLVLKCLDFFAATLPDCEQKIPGRLPEPTAWISFFRFEKETV